MDDQQYAKQTNTEEQPLPKDVCDEIAKKVARLLQQDKAQDYFSGQIAELCRTAERCADHVRTCLRDPELAAKPTHIESDDLTEKAGLLYWHKRAAEEAGKQEDVEQIDKAIAENKELWALRNAPPEPGCTVISLLDEMWNFFELGLSWPGDYFAIGRWMRPGPANPVTWFGLFAAWDTPNLTVDERRMHDCFLLAAIHDNEFHATTSRLYDSHELVFPEGYQGRFKRDKFVEAIWHHYSSFDSKHKSDERSRALQNAYSRVESYLDEWLEQRESQEKAGQGKPTSSGDKAKDIKKRFRFHKAQAFFNERDLGLPTGAEVKPAEILKKLVRSFGKVVPFKDLDENSGDTASDFLRGKVRVIRRALEKRKVPCKILSKKWTGYVLSSSRTHS